MILTMQREPSVGGATLSKLSVDGTHVCDILEDVVREIPGTPVAQWKVFGATAIPAGRYRLTFEHSNRFGPETLTVHGVPGFVGIRVHGGNTAAHTEGCLLPGARNTKSTVAYSQIHLASLRDVVRAGLSRDGEVWIDILPALETA
jgi:hypothetical protein